MIKMLKGPLDLYSTTKNVTTFTSKGYFLPLKAFIDTKILPTFITSDAL